MNKISTTLLVFGIALCSYADKIAEYKLDAKNQGTAEAKDVIDSAGELKSNATKRVNWPFWTATVDYNDQKIKVPGTGVAIGMTMSNGHEFGNGKDDELMLDEGPFTIAFRLFNSGKGDFRIGKKGVFQIRIFEAKGNQHFVAFVTIKGKNYNAWGNPGKVGEWHEYVMIFNPAGKALQTFVDGKKTGQIGVPNSPADSKPDSPLFYNNFGRPKQYLESLVVFDHAINGNEMKKLCLAKDK